MTACRWDEPVFVVGHPRSGTTLVRDLLDLSPHTAITNESYIPWFVRMTQCLAGVPTNGIFREGPSTVMGLVNPRMIEQFAAIHLDGVLKMLKSFYGETFASKPFQVWGDKVTFGFHAIEDLRAVFPGLRLLLVVRDPRDCIASVMAWQKRQVEAGQLERAKSPLELANHWNELNSELSQLGGTDRQLLIRYEDIDDRLTLAAMLEFLNLPEWTGSEAELTTSVSQRFEQHATSPTRRSSIGRHRHQLTTQELEMIQRSCGETARGFGYRLDRPAESSKHPRNDERKDLRREGEASP